ncbi:MAG: NosD domain-containing protein [Candidatus Micrarchaeaceae archaeon]
MVDIDNAGAGPSSGSGPQAVDKSNANATGPNIPSGAGQTAPQPVKFDVTPESPIGAGHPSAPPKKIKRIRPFPVVRLLVLAVIVALVAVLAFVYISRPHVSPTTSTISTTTIKQSSFSKINSCSSLGSPGTYYLSSDIKYKPLSGTCINITASNVSLICNGNSLTGSGPYGSVPPFTYGVALHRVSNVLITGCSISNFSYGVAVYSSNNIVLRLNNVTRNPMAEILLNATRSSNISENYLSKSLSGYGSLYLSNNSTNNIVLNNTIALGALVGVNVNSSGNRFVDNYIYGSPNSFSCALRSGLIGSNKASGNICTNETGCSFLSCKGINTPPNISAITLSKSIDSCGSITFPGTYRLSGNVYMDQMLNTSNPLAAGIPCISIYSPNVALNCSGFSVANATTAIYVHNTDNVSLSDCRIANSKIGVSVFRSSRADMQNISSYNTGTAFSYVDSNGSIGSGISAQGGTYGIYLSGSSTITLTNFRLYNNTYGVYVTGSLGNAFSNGNIANSTKFAVFAATDSANASDNFMQSTSCGLTNAAWAPCAQHLSASATFYPVSSCGVINRPGNYTLQNNLVPTSPQCFTIKSSNVAFNCAYHSITLSSSNPAASAFTMGGLSNVSISNCTVNNFPYAVEAYNSSKVNISKVDSANARIAIMLSNTINGKVSDSLISGASNTSIYLNRTRNLTIVDNNITGTASDIGILISNSTQNMVFGNSGKKNGVGLYVKGDSLNNTIFNNTMQISSTSDYACSPQDSGISAENGGINYGTTKQLCHWLAAVSPISPLPSCTAFLTPSSVQLTSDYEYTGGSICFGVYANGTSINCNGHTIISNSNGTFAFFKNSQSSSLENCYLKGFSSPVKAYNSSLSVINNTVYAYTPDSTGVGIVHSSNINVRQNNIYSNGVGIALSNDSSGSLLNNVVNASSVAYLISDSSGLDAKVDTSTYSSGLGVSLINSTASSFQDNNFYGVAGGIVCSYASQGASNNTDLGGNICSSGIDCGWISLSKTTCH